MNAFGRVHQDSLGLLLVKTNLEFRDLVVTGPKKSSKSKKKKKVSVSKSKPCPYVRDLVC